MKIEIEKPKEELLDCMRFVIRAKSKDSTRYALNFVKIEKGRFVATDGRRLHIADIEHGFEPGMYKVISCKKTGVVLLTADDPGIFPKYEDIIPDHKTSFKVGSHFGVVPASCSVAFGLAKQDIMVNPDYLADAADGESWQVYCGDPDRAVLLVSDNKKAVLMPVNHDEVEFKVDCSVCKGDPDCGLEAFHDCQYNPANKVEAEAVEAA